MMDDVPGVTARPSQTAIVTRHQASTTCCEVQRNSGTDKQAKIEILWIRMMQVASKDVGMSRQPPMGSLR